jgi:pimeloyl-ACP methyl ester carboxylesterase
VRVVQAGDAKRYFWRWHGQLVDFLVAEPEGGADDNTPTVLLVHGFGAFAEHWRRNIPALAAEGCKVYACTLPGFGPSEKSPQNYTTALWKAYVRDFVVHVIGKPVVVAGNSIGGVVPANSCAGALPFPSFPINHIFIAH